MCYDFIKVLSTKFLDVDVSLCFDNDCIKIKFSLTNLIEKDLNKESIIYNILKASWDLLFAQKA